MTPSVGDRAPEFSLPVELGQDPVRLADYKGDKNVVLLFFPFAWSPVCTQELCSMRDDYNSLQDSDTEVLAVSADNPFTLQAWAEDQGYQFPLLSDFNKDAAEAYGVLIEDLAGLQGVPQRAVFVIDKEGIVRHVEVTPTPRELPDFDAIRSTIEGLT